MLLGVKCITSDEQKIIGEASHSNWASESAGPDQA